LTRTLPKTCIRCAGHDLPTCFYCGNTAAKRHEHDHYPVPARAGGAHVVPACYNCHDLKDRVRLCDWNVSDYVMAAWELFGVLGVEAHAMSREVLTDPAECSSVMFAAILRHLDLHTTPRWAVLSTLGRILFAKLACMATGDIPVEDEQQRANRRTLLAPWVDLSDPRYRDVIDHGAETYRQQVTAALAAAAARETSTGRSGSPMKGHIA
jgi:hypothetical protein